MVTEAELKELAKEATKQHDLLSAGIAHTRDLQKLLKKIIDLPGAKPRPRKKYSASMERWIQKLDEDFRLKEETYQEAIEIQKMLNLVSPPHYKRILEYRRTGDICVFDGLKRN